VRKIIFCCGAIDGIIENFRRFLRKTIAERKVCRHPVPPVGLPTSLACSVPIPHVRTSDLSESDPSLPIQSPQDETRATAIFTVV
jgi:hypothetical protein